MNLTPLLAKRGHSVAIAAPAGSVRPSPDVQVYQVEGRVPAYATTAARDLPITAQADGVLERMWELAAREQDRFDAIIGINYDWLAYYVTPYFRTPVGHIISIGSQIDAVDAIVKERFYEFPHRFAVNTCAQANTFQFIDPCRMMSLYGGVDLDAYVYTPQAEPRLSWVARISPEKGLVDAFAVAAATGMPLDVCGKLQSPAYLDECKERYPKVDFTYHGFLDQMALHRIVRCTKAMLMTPHWIEAFGNTCIEALAGGTPVIAYNYGGPSELIEEGVSGFLVPPRDAAAMADAVRRLDTLDRANARKRGEQFSMQRFAERYEHFIERVITGSANDELPWEWQASHPFV
jgi:UDP-glucose:tetrahydrobiopterin glucosyltransferase